MNKFFFDKLKNKWSDSTTSLISQVVAIIAIIIMLNLSITSHLVFFIILIIIEFFIVIRLLLSFLTFSLNLETLEIEISLDPFDVHSFPKLLNKIIPTATIDQEKINYDDIEFSYQLSENRIYYFKSMIPNRNAELIFNKILNLKNSYFEFSKNEQIPNIEFNIQIKFPNNYINGHGEGNKDYQNGMKITVINNKAEIFFDLKYLENEKWDTIINKVKKLSLV